ncbi:uncharacterized conserved protein [Borrelia duttonii Ly]|uniref:Uncharacterized conserved protein n=1 Tax=Borrelia duttonii (strain Ly) TaxID=412419 RepID=B5RN11_BORDL|nr:uncharacterized conserved protein [Borrelia duttonii Ly]
MKSMTGFFHLEKAISNYMFSVNLKSYNGKFLEFKFKLPEVLYAYELDIRNFIATYVKRGNYFYLSGGVLHLVYLIFLLLYLIFLFGFYYYVFFFLFLVFYWYVFL